MPSHRPLPSALQINWENRLAGSGNGLINVTIDGTDYRIQEPHPFSTQWYGHKFNGAGVRYEIGVHIESGWIVWVNDPYPCGLWPDLAIAKNLLHLCLLPNEQYIADDTYRCPEALLPEDACNLDEYEYMDVARARHEQVNRLFKGLSNIFKREVTKHGLFMHAVANIVDAARANDGVMNVFDVHERAPLAEGW
jgi:hypothetical protein